MRKFLILTVSVLFFGCNNKIINQKINTESVEKFWKITEFLKKDNKLNDLLWDSYYNLIGNKKYMENNRSKQNVADHRKFLELFFRPSLSDSLSSVLENGRFENNGIFQNILFIKDNENKLKDYTKIITSANYFYNSIELAKQYLPKNNNEQVPEELKIYLQAITYDAAVQNNSMYFGLSVVYDFDKFRKGAAIAHELHHVLRKNKSLVNKLTKRDSSSYRIVTQINNEGVADLNDKKLVVNNSKEVLLGSLFKKALIDDAENVITKLDSCFIINSKRKGSFIDKSNFRKITNSLSGHVPGYYMSSIIERNGKLKELIDSSDNPFKIFYLYNKVAKKDKTQPKIYSEASIEYLKILEKRAFQ